MKTMANEMDKVYVLSKDSDLLADIEYLKEDKHFEILINKIHCSVSYVLEYSMYFGQGIDKIGKFGDLDKVISLIYEYKSLIERIREEALK